MPIEKSLEFVLLNLEWQFTQKDSFLLEDDSIALRGIVTLNSHMNEEKIRGCLAEAIQPKYPCVAPQDIEFLKATRRKLTKPVNAGEFSFQEVKLLAGQGSIYTTVKEGFECLLEEGMNDLNEFMTEKAACQDTSALTKEDTANMQDKYSDSNIITFQDPLDKDDEYLTVTSSGWSGNSDVELAAKECLKACQTNKITNPVEVLRFAHTYIVQKAN